MSARYRKDEQALVQLTRHSTRHHERAGYRHPDMNSAALLFVPYEDLQAAV